MHAQDFLVLGYTPMREDAAHALPLPYQNANSTVIKYVDERRDENAVSVMYVQILVAECMCSAPANWGRFVLEQSKN